MILYADIPGERLDAFLARCAEGLSRSAAQKLIEEGAVTRNGKPGKKNDKLNMGDAIAYEIPEAKPVDIVPTEMKLDIVYEDEDLLVINRQAPLSMGILQARILEWVSISFSSDGILHSHKKE